MNIEHHRGGDERRPQLDIDRSMAPLAVIDRALGEFAAGPAGLGRVVVRGRLDSGRRTLLAALAQHAGRTLSVVNAALLVRESRIGELAEILRRARPRPRAWTPGGRDYSAFACKRPRIHPSCRTLATSMSRTPMLGRLLLGAAARRPTTVKKHTILFLAAQPDGTDPLALDQEAHAIQAELERSRGRDSFEFVTRWAAEPLDLLRELRALQPTIVHFSGHGSAGAPHAAPTLATADGQRARDITSRDDEARPGLLFQGPAGDVRSVSVTALRDAFGTAGSTVRLIVLNACYSEFAADALLEHVDCVVGAPGSILDVAARSFAVGFYGGLGALESIAAAHRDGCAAIGLDGAADNDLPKLRIRQGIDPGKLTFADRVPRHPKIGRFATLAVAATAPVVVLGLQCAIRSHLETLIVPQPTNTVPSAARSSDVTIFLRSEADPLVVPRTQGALSLVLGSDRRTQRVDDRGAAQFDGVPASMRDKAVSLSLDAQNYELPQSSQALLLNGTTFYVAVRPKQLVLAGYVWNERGQPLAHARASIAGRATGTDQDGRFKIMLPADLPEGDRTVTVTAAGYETWRAQATPGGNSLHVRLAATPQEK